MLKKVGPSPLTNIAAKCVRIFPEKTQLNVFMYNIDYIWGSGNRHNMLVNPEPTYRHIIFVNEFEARDFENSP